MPPPAARDGPVVGHAGLAAWRPRAGTRPAPTRRPVVQVCGKRFGMCVAAPLSGGRRGIVAPGPVESMAGWKGPVG